MHEYLRAIGFSKLDRNRQIRSLLDEVRFNEDESKEYVSENQNGVAEYRKDFANRLGILNYWLIDGEVEESDSYMPYYNPNILQFYSTINVEKTVNADGYYCEIEDSRVGISIIFRLLNWVEYLKQRNTKRMYHISAGALSTEGTIILGVKKEMNQVKRMEKIEQHQKTIIAARKGDKAAAEQLAKEDYDQYQSMNYRISREDLYSVVDSCFMPYGMNSDCYTIVGDIVRYRIETNDITNEKIYVITVDYNTVLIEVAINEIDLMGEPEAGRRFKGKIWLQGIVHFDEEEVAIDRR